MSGDRNSWNLTGAAMALVVVTALVAGLVVASWTGDARDVSARADAVARSSAGTPATIVAECHAQARGEAGDQPIVLTGAALTTAADEFDGVRSPEARYVRAYRECLRERGFSG
jgi:hypothetical protein